jgi:NADPH:quinone reductase-like Zn-dependent oxidoreductase
VRDAFFIVQPDRTQLATVARMVAAGELRAVAGAVYPLADASEAYRRKPARGKVVVTMPDSPLVPEGRS